ncbi:MAG: hypothetical protein FJX57_03510 [Alphaproteobacteria bacterium]|nr:hypothetical protein [Alphaproteobacteria bacterium]
MLAAANRVVRQDVAVRVRRLVQAGDEAIALSPTGELVWEGATVARLAAGAEALAPRIEVQSSDLLEGPHREAIRRRLAAWLDAHLTAVLAPLFTLRAAELTGSARGLAYELVAQFGCVSRGRVAPLVSALSPDERASLRRLGVVIGDVAVFLPALRSHATLGLRALLWRLFAGEDPGKPMPQPALSHSRVDGMSTAFFQSQFCLPAGPRFVRADRLDRLARDVFRKAREGGFALDPAWAAAIGAPSDAMDGVLRALGLRGAGDGAERRYGLKPRARRRQNAELRREALVDETSPFAGLAKLVRR